VTLAAATFVCIFLFAVPFPLIVLAAALLGLTGFDRFTRGAGKFADPWAKVFKTQRGWREEES
jgi:hypothetical protein